MRWNDSIDDTDAEEKRLKEFIERNPKDAQAHYELGAVYENIGDYSQAIEYCQKAIALDPRNQIYCAFLVFLYGMRVRDDERLLDAAAGLADLHPDENDWHIERAIDSLDGVDDKSAKLFIAVLELQDYNYIAETLERWIWNP